MVVIAKSKCRKQWSNLTSPFGVAAVACLLLSGCTSSMDLFSSADKVDRSISTGTVPKVKSGDAQSDETTVRNAVTSADLAKVGGNPLPWANSATGSAGVVSTIREDRGQGHVCRAFTTTRHSYEGVAMFSGQACMTDKGDWLLTAFDRQ
ncbi:RT0821/Lpp0805 family surface protein [Neorhizobium alkalisoli]|uniref:Outer membrane surface antigen n=1 Tax=Neorhizobium alkalisoli TaxID=528178 RepID=A0A561R3R1_9HYPH|nr:RT0821/Lpp0805 family surface protein [Neorhizobium alkalisoli]TWF57221.1 outer membrane surface antigen [Neorhizobium alkalisoli]